MEALRFQEIAVEGAFDAPALELRVRVLREPLNVPVTPEDLALERGYLHFGLICAEAVLATVMADALTPRRVQLRQMAVTPERQRGGLGRALLEGTHGALRARGFREAVLDARLPVVAFYTRLGYRSLGQPFDKVGHPHQQMERAL